MATTSRTLDERGKRQATELGIDPERVPPGQYLTSKFPVLTFGDNPPYDLWTWDFAVFGAIERPFALTWTELMELPQQEVTADIHCVTRWSKLDTAWRGVAVSHVLELAGVRPEGTHAMAYSDGGYTANMPLEDLWGDDVLLAHTYAGLPLEPDHGAPLRLLLPKRYFWKSAKFLRKIEVMTEDRKGFWERNGYHNEADPWREERHWF